PLDAAFDTDYLWRVTRRRRVAIKQLLMNSRLVVGVGNIYANEALFRAKVRPRRQARGLSRSEVARLARAVRAVLTQAVGAGRTIPAGAGAGLPAVSGARPGDRPPAAERHGGQHYPEALRELRGQRRVSDSAAGARGARGDTARGGLLVLEDRLAQGSRRQHGRGSRP